MDTGRLAESGHHVERAVTSLDWANDYLCELATCLCAGVKSAGLPEPCFCGVMPGDAVARDYCDPCDDGRCGAVWARLVSIASESQLPDGGTTAICNLVIPVLNIEVGAVRCAPMPDSDGTPPDEAAMLGATQIQIVEAGVMHDAIACCADKYDVVLGSYTPTGPAGGCLGGIWTAQVRKF